jgi:hypothetical protein
MGKGVRFWQLKRMAEPTATPPARQLFSECSGACGDLGTFIPHVIEAMTVAGLAPGCVIWASASNQVPTFPQRCRVGPGSFTPSRSQIRT